MEHEPEKMELGGSDTRRPLPGREGRSAHLRRLEKGAKVVAGNQSGTFLEPTVQTDAATSMVITQEETFGPVAPLHRLKTDAEAIKMANDPPTQPFPARGRGRVGWRGLFLQPRHRPHLARRRGPRIRHRRDQRRHHLVEIPLARSRPSAA
jgi:hypothetical protein